MIKLLNNQKTGKLEGEEEEADRGNIRRIKLLKQLFR
jgi:hypothetical protein